MSPCLFLISIGVQSIPVQSTGLLKSSLVQNTGSLNTFIKVESLDKMKDIYV